MAVSNITGFSVGQDLQRVLFIPQNGGGAIDSTALGRLLEFTAHPIITKLRQVPINNGGIALNRNIYEGWSGEVDFGRYNGALAYLMGSVMGTFNQSGIETFFNIEALVLDSTSGSFNTYTFINAVISDVPIGHFSGISDVKQRLAFVGGQMLINGQLPGSVGAIA